MLKDDANKKMWLSKTLNAVINSTVKPLYQMSYRYYNNSSGISIVQRVHRIFKSTRSQPWSRRRRDEQVNIGFTARCTYADDVVCPSICDVELPWSYWLGYFESNHINNYSLGSSLCRAATSQLVQEEHPQFGWIRDGDIGGGYYLSLLECQFSYGIDMMLNKYRDFDAIRYLISKLCWLV